MNKVEPIGERREDWEDEVTVFDDDDDDDYVLAMI